MANITPYGGPLPVAQIQTRLNELVDLFIIDWDRRVRDPVYVRGGLMNPEFFNTITSNATLEIFTKQDIAIATERVALQATSVNTTIYNTTTIYKKPYSFTSGADWLQRMMAAPGESNIREADMRRAMDTMRRNRDGVILTALNNTQTTNVITSEYGFSVGDLVTIGEQMTNLGIPYNDRFVFITPAQMSSLMNDQRYINVQYSQDYSLKNGRLTDFYGFNFIVVAPFFFNSLQTKYGLKNDGTYEYAIAVGGRGYQSPVGVLLNWMSPDIKIDPYASGFNFASIMQITDMIGAGIIEEQAMFVIKTKIGANPPPFPVPPTDGALTLKAPSFDTAGINSSLENTGLQDNAENIDLVQNENDFEQGSSKKRRSILTNNY